MPAAEVVVADTSPLLNLALIDRTDLLRSQFSSLSVPETVRSELLAGEAGVERLESLLESEFVSIVTPQRDDLVRELRTELDADLVLIDERDGRQVARRHDLSVTGVIGVLLRAARRGELAIEPELDALREAGFWIGDDLYRRAIAAAEEEHTE